MCTIFTPFPSSFRSSQTNHLHSLIGNVLWTSTVAQSPTPCDVRLEVASYLLSLSIRGWPANMLRQTVWQRLDLCPNNSKGKYSKWFIKLSSRELKSLEIMSVTALAGCCGDRQRCSHTSPSSPTALTVTRSRGPDVCVEKSLLAASYQIVQSEALDIKCNITVFKALTFYSRDCPDFKIGLHNRISTEPFHWQKNRN